VPEAAKFLAFTDYRHPVSSAIKNMSSYSLYRDNYFIYVHADIGEAKPILPIKVPALGLNPMGDDTTFIFLFVNV
jgi:hypothetical protein